MTLITEDDFTAKIIRSSKRKTVSIKISKGQVIINAPTFLSHETLEAIIARKRDWIKAKLTIQEKFFAIKPKKFIDNETFSYLGETYTLTISVGNKTNLQINNQELIATVQAHHVHDSILIEKLIIQWYRKQAEIVLKEKTAYYALLIGVNPTSIKIRTFKARWGSCSINGDIQYNWKIMMAPETIINYLVIHELCHIHHHNHSPIYWQTVAKYCLHYKEHGRWLKQNGAYLEF